MCKEPKSLTSSSPSSASSIVMHSTNVGDGAFPKKIKTKEQQGTSFEEQ